MRTIKAAPLCTGIVGVLDALGAASYGPAEIERFMESRRVVLDLLQSNAENVAEQLDVEMVKASTFNDTVLVVLKSASDEVTPTDIRAFFTVMRKFITDSLVNGILFRGSVAFGTFHMSEATNTTLGQAVTDAAAWYNVTEWMGVIATPRASLMIQHAIEKNKKNWDFLMLDYEVPLKNGGKVRLKAVNWPKTFLEPSLTPCKGKEEPRAKLFELLEMHAIPKGVESKFFNMVEFFDHAIAKARKSDRRTRVSIRTSQTAPPPATI